jgi:hypothetical protein
LMRFGDVERELKVGWEEKEVEEEGMEMVR